MVQAHPDAQFYKFKTVPNYHKLCVIFGIEGFSGRQSHMAYNIDPDVGDPVMMTGNSRMNWTPPMDRYFIDLMLEKVQRGRIISHTFDKQAWLEIVAAFRDTFGSQHDKYVLRGRNKSLRKLYNDIKGRQDHSEFSWDEAQQMVRASDDIWDSYIKEYPEGKSFRAKTRPSYNDLCLIYGNLTSDERHFNGAGRGIQALQNGGCLMHGWTPPMDRYFIDLMLEEIRRGSMVNQKFNKQAWTNMVAKFNAHFGFQYRKGVLKNHFKYLRKQFNDMKDLLDQIGFVWDEMRCMINAAADRWDAYIKENPHLQSYRNRPLPNYNDLSLIYANKMNEGLNHWIDVDGDIRGVNSGKQDYQYSAASDTMWIDWSKQMDQYFIDLMLKQVFEGNSIDHTLNNQAWDYIITSFNEKFGLCYDKCILENRYLCLMKQYEDISNLLNQQGFAWDESQQMITADDDFWEAYIEEHPDAIMYKDKVFKNYGDLNFIFGNGIQEETNYLDLELGIDRIGPEMRGGKICGDIRSLAMDVKTSDGSKKRRVETTSALECAREIKKNSKEKLQNAGRSNKQGKNYSSIESIVGALQAIPNMEDELFLDACNLLEDEKKAKAFVKMYPAQRKKWLLRKLRS